MRWAPGWRPGVGWCKRGAWGRLGEARCGVSSLQGWVRGTRRRLVGKGWLGAGLRGSNVSCGEWGTCKRSRWESTVHCGARRHGWGRAVGQRKGRSP